MFWENKEYLAFPSCGILSFPSIANWAAAAKKVGALQYAYCPKGEPGSPLIHPASNKVKEFVPLKVRVAPLNPNQRATTLLAGSCGTTKLFY